MELPAPGLRTLLSQAPHACGRKHRPPPRHQCGAVEVTCTPDSGSVRYSRIPGHRLRHMVQHRIDVLACFRSYIAQFTRKGTRRVSLTVRVDMIMLRKVL
ncbi:hypothetical protein GCM10012275_36680 [Longimycelium tulufanense]|uniref:Uncharacterized protein n=1 Tax=Longimycelium tulufanense TaxID=907463 RepID=A0A8J3FW12_9PSEU|nr:hypothetical protein GCM10012275_36680 [Longimycelium tulufanense]